MIEINIIQLYLYLKTLYFWHIDIAYLCVVVYIYICTCIVSYHNVTVQYMFRDRFVCFHIQAINKTPIYYN